MNNNANNKLSQDNDEISPAQAWKTSILNPKQKEPTKKFTFLYIIIFPVISAISLCFTYYVIYSDRSSRTEVAIVFTTLIALALGGIIDIIRFKKRKA